MNTGNIIRCIVRERSVTPFLEAGMTSEWLNDKQGFSFTIFPPESAARRAYIWLLERWKNDNEVPSEGSLRDRFGDQVVDDEILYQTEDVTAQSQIDLAVNEVQRSILTQTMLRSDALAQIDDDVPAAVEQFLFGARKLAAGLRRSKGRLVTLADPAFDLEAFMAPEETEGIPFGIAPIDDYFGGWKSGQLITFLGRQKSLKTMMLLWSAYCAWDQGNRILFYSVEMDETVLRQRLYGIGAEVNPNRFRRGKLTEEEKEAIREFQVSVEEDAARGIDFAISRKTAMLSVDDIEREIREFHPDAVYVDGFYFMRDRITSESAGSDWRAHENVATELKELAMTHSIPVITSTQVQEKQHNKKQRGIEASSIMGGTGLLRSSDLVLGFDKTQGEDSVFINCVYSRYGQFEDIEINWDWDRMDITASSAIRMDVSDRV